MVNKLTGLEGGLEVGQKINEIIDNKADVNADTTGNAGTATKLATARTISLTGDITGSTTFDGSANKSITTTLGNTTKIDGQWVSSTRTLSTATAVGTYTIDLSDYLPNDNYNYEVNIKIFTEKSTSGVGTLNIYSDIINSDTENYWDCAVNQNSIYASKSVILPISRYVYVKIRSNALKIHSSVAVGYKRLGTNS